MCISCNPICGHCHPPKMRAVFCPQCDEYNIFPIVISATPPQRACSKCGADLTALAIPKTVRCENTGRVCANPCGYSAVPPNPKIIRVCRENTPPPTSRKPREEAILIGKTPGLSDL